MEHIENHPHAFLDESNIVKNVFVFDGHNHELLEQIKQITNASKVICCCDNGIAYIEGDFYNNKFYPPKRYPEWIRNEEKGEWVAPEGWVNPDIIVE